jgi:hypothetical protein
VGRSVAHTYDVRYESRCGLWGGRWLGAWVELLLHDAAQMKRGGRGCDGMPARDAPASGPRRPRSLPPTPGGSVRRSTRPPWDPPRGDVSSSPAVDGSGGAAAASGGAGHDLRVVTPALAVPPPRQVPQNPFDTLPDEMVIAVFMWVARRDPKAMLTVVHAVCQRWRRLCGDTQSVRFDFSFLPESAKLRKLPLDAVAEVAMVVSLVGLARRFKHVVECNLDEMLVHDSADSYAIAPQRVHWQIALFLFCVLSPHSRIMSQFMSPGTKVRSPNLTSTRPSQS